jgi:hypothetical protein
MGSIGAHGRNFCRRRKIRVVKRTGFCVLASRPDFSSALLRVARNGHCPAAVSAGGYLAAPGGIGSAVVVLIASIAKRLVTSRIGATAISRL